jgi:predicted hydrolase (HD superfamily)
MDKSLNVIDRIVSRDDIVNGATQLGVDLDEHIAFCIEAMRAHATQLGIEGTRYAESV